MSLFRKLLSLSLVVCFIALPQVACEKKEEATAAAKPKGNVFEPHKLSVRDEAFTLTAQELQNITDEASMQKVFLMPHRVATNVIGKDHIAWGKITHGMNVAKEGDESEAAKNIIEAFEEQNIAYRNNDGGFHLRLKPHKGFGFEMIWDAKTLYMRDREGAWRNEKSDGKHEFFLEKGTSSLDRFYRNFRGHMTFTKKGTETYEGRTVAVIEIAFDKKGHEAAKELPNTSHTKDKYRLNIKKSYYSIEKERTVMKDILPISGTLYVDTKTGAPLKGNVKGGYTKIISGKSIATLTMAYEFAWKEIGKTASILPPGKDTQLQQKQRTRMNVHRTFKDMPKKLQDKSGVNVPKPIVKPKPKKEDTKADAAAKPAEAPKKAADKPAEGTQ